MSYHEAFWIVAGTAAPVIALAALVALPDTSDIYQDLGQALLDEQLSSIKQFYALYQVNFDTELAKEYRKLLGPPDELVESRFFKNFATVIRLGAVGNVFLQAGLLAACLAALAYDRDVIPPWIAVILAVGGVLLLAGIVSALAKYRKMKTTIIKNVNEQLPEAYQEVLQKHLQGKLNPQRPSASS